MPLVVGEGLRKVYGPQEVIKNATFAIERGNRIGLVGRNGEGKTTLLRLLVGQEEPTSGGVQMSRGMRIAYLPQDPPAFKDTTLWDFMHSAFADLHQLHADMEALADKLSGPAASQDMLNRYGELQAQFENRGGYEMENRIKTVLTGLELGPEHYQMPLSKLSGGQRTRALLGTMLLGQPDLLLLDEPTNHLDLEATEWLENYLTGSNGTMLIVSHDRYFLDRTTNITWEFSFGNLEDYTGNYSAYQEQRELRHKERMRRWESQQELIEKTRVFVARYGAALRTKQAHGRVTKLERYLKNEGIDRPMQHQDINLRLNAGKRSGDIVLRTEDLTIGYNPQRPLISLPNLQVERGDRIAIIGGNGVGKTTLIRTMLGQLSPLAGQVKLGASIKLGYLSQTHDNLDPNLTAIETLIAVRPTELTSEQARNILGAFLFTGQNVFKRVSDLSGGERSRVVLARLTLEGANVLIMDEPTNHLDIASQEILQEVLSEYEGTVLFVSHDRYLIQQLATDIWVIRDGGIKDIGGGWDEFQRWRSGPAEMPKPNAPPSKSKPAAPAPKGKPALAKTATKAPAKPTAKSVAPAGNQNAPEEAQPPRQKPKKLDRRKIDMQQNKIKAVENNIRVMEAKLAELSAAISKASVAGEFKEINQKADEYQAADAQLKRLMQQWEELNAGLEKLLAEQNAGHA